jgi:hypothetical protein
MKVHNAMQVFILRSGDIVIESFYFMSKFAQVFGNDRDDFARLVNLVEDSRGTAYLQAMAA